MSLKQLLIRYVPLHTVVKRGKTRSDNNISKPELPSYPKKYCNQLRRQDLRATVIERKRCLIDSIARI